LRELSFVLFLVRTYVKLKLIFRRKNVKRKILQVVPIIMIISEKEASVSFPRLDGNVDFPSFFGSDPAFLKWVNDLYLNYWEQAKIWYSSI